ncbi:hypothetical protein MPH_11428 [Macrophomina phaseolina MS6]|uniref:Uncharacterized protein n=1 Tax=Macrophomina phaseolina (strain MS6) TaxID=1126212 RepID=K2RAB1_MACPH|nr:hypothetical protein MPH_11428 [Macrophomina phaseolina MS6]
MPQVCPFTDPTSLSIGRRVRCATCSMRTPSGWCRGQDQAIGKAFLERQHLTDHCRLAEAARRRTLKFSGFGRKPSNRAWGLAQHGNTTETVQTKLSRVVLIKLTLTVPQQRDTDTPLPPAPPKHPRSLNSDLLARRIRHYRNRFLLRAVQHGPQLRRRPPPAAGVEVVLLLSDVRVVMHRTQTRELPYDMGSGSHPELCTSCVASAPGVAYICRHEAPAVKLPCLSPDRC